VQADCPFNVSLALNCIEPLFTEGSTCVVTANFYAASTGLPFTPASVTYRVDDINSGASIVATTSVTPAPSVSITVTGAQNALLSDMRYLEDHQLTVTVEDSYGNVANVPIRWLVQRVFPSI
jgi:hypothetical protein